MAHLIQLFSLHSKRPSPLRDIGDLPRHFSTALRRAISFSLPYPGIARAPGGVPIVVDGKLVGAIGVSGGNADQDSQVAGAGAAAPNN